ncbi:MAG TPA: tripartite tricarboxylate transporter substrate binding protein [Casimicrobiaceae bacterium]|nr:tripartite tricarboxylate transporter substrate binding protein [Casimicrobiaceae bacterium]
MLRTLALAVLLAVAPLASPAFAAWPERPVKILIGYAPGGSTDVVARLIQPKLQEKLGQPVIIENKPGGAGDYAAELMLQAPADGYTLMMSTVALHAINPGMYKQKFDPVEDFAPIAFVCSYPMIMIGSPQTTFRTPSDLAQQSMANPMFYSSSGVGSPGHLAGELLVRSTDAKLTHVPYKGGAPSVFAIISGEAQVNFATLPAVVPQIRAGKVRAIALASRQRNPAVPDVPTMEESGLKDFDVGTWSGLIGPKSLPPDIVRKVNDAVAFAVNDPAIQKRLLDEGTEIRTMSPQEFGTFIRAENARWVKVVREAGIRPQ